MNDLSVVSKRTGTEVRKDLYNNSNMLTCKRWIIARLLLCNGHSLEDFRIFDDGESNLSFGQGREEGKVTEVNVNEKMIRLASKAPEKDYRSINFFTKQAISGKTNQSIHTASYATFLRQTEVNDGNE